jgi:hypothetical protein
MKIRILCALMAMAIAGAATAQAVQQPPGAGTPPAPLAGGLPPLPPGCAGNGAAPPPPPRPPVTVNDAGFATSLGISSAQASKVQQVFEHQSAQAQRLDQQRREIDAETCRSLRSIVGDQGMARWSAATPPPPPGGPGWRGPGRGPGEMTPPPPPPPPQGS